MPPVYKVSYFDLTALGEPIRFLLSYGGLEFEDNRIQKENWPALKPNTPFGQVPTLEYNGKVAHQSVAISRYLAKQVKLVGKDDWEDLEIDAAVDTVNDLRMKIALYHYESDEKVKETKAGPLFKEILPNYLEKLDAQAKKNNGYLAVGRRGIMKNVVHYTSRNSFSRACTISGVRLRLTPELSRAHGKSLVSGLLTWADVYFIALLDYINFMAKKDIIADCPNLQEVKQNVLKLPNVKAWIEKRPKDNL